MALETSNSVSRPIQAYARTMVLMASATEADQDSEDKSVNGSKSPTTATEL